ncbi:MAG: TIGR03790 family protein [Prosthecobacter sp.]
MKAAVFLLLLMAAHVAAQSPEWDAAAETAVVFNPDFPGSADLAAYYAEKRGIPKERIIGLSCPKTDSMSRAEFEEKLRQPLLKIFQDKGWWNVPPPLTGTPPPEKDDLLEVKTGVRVLALMRGVPFQIRRAVENPKQSQEDEASVDSELTVLGLNKPPTSGGLRNPWFDQPARFHRAKQAAGLLLVGRLDGPDDAVVRRMIDDALDAEQNGLFGRAVIDLAQKSEAYKQGEDWLLQSAAAFEKAGIPVFIDREPSLVGDFWPLPDTILYFGWYTGQISGALSSPTFKFKRGAIACHLHSFSAGVIRTHDQAWVGPLLSKGAAASFGNVFEPFLSLTMHFDVFNKRLLEGFTVSEAAWNATPALSWMNVVLGDPLYRPFGRGIGTKLGQGADRDYALYQGMVLRHAGETEAHVKAALTELAEKRESTKLLELTALLSALQFKLPEAIDLLEHAAFATREVADILRMQLYRAEMMRRAGKPDAARQLLREVLKDDAYKNQPALPAVEFLLKALGG